MRNEAEIHRCKECKHLQPTEIGIVKFGVCLLNDYKVKKGPLSKERSDKLLSKITYNMPDIGIMGCEDKEQIICTLRVCDKENTFSPRKDLKYWFSLLQNTANQCSKLIPRI